MAEEPTKVSSYFALTSLVEMGKAQAMSKEPTVVVEHTQCIHPGSRFYRLHLSFYHDV